MDYSDPDKEMAQAWAAEWTKAESEFLRKLMSGGSMDFVTKDSGKREEFASGMVRDTQDDKPRYDLIWRPGLKRVAELYARGSVKYSARNWMKAASQEELDRFVASANRHFEAWIQGDRTEDHMAGCIFNLFGAEYAFRRMESEGKSPKWSCGE